MSDETTKPTIETVLERMEAFRKSIHDQIAEFRDSVESEIHKLDRKIGVLSEDILTLRADVRMLEKARDSND